MKKNINSNIYLCLSFILSLSIFSTNLLYLSGYVTGQINEIIFKNAVIVQIAAWLILIFMTFSKSLKKGIISLISLPLALYPILSSLYFASLAIIFDK